MMAESPRHSLTVPIFKTLRTITVGNIEYFQKQNSSQAERFYSVFCIIQQNADAMEPTVAGIQSIAHNFDFGPEVPGNGYRSLLKIIFSCLGEIVNLSRHVTVNRGSLIFRSNHYYKELEAYSDVLAQLRAELYYAQKLLAASKHGELFPEGDEVSDQLMQELGSFNMECFYGRCVGFQFCKSMQNPLQVVSVAMASYADGYHQHDGPVARAASSFLQSGKYMMNPELKAQQIVSVTQKADISFCKAFWSLTEGDFLKQLSTLTCNSVQVNKVMLVHAEAFEMDSVEGAKVTITPPCSHTGPAPVQVRLISFIQREGKLQGNPPKDGKPVAPRSKSLLFHLHGGGFVAHSSKSHESYLRIWARDLGVPILSVDYSLAPDLPFPRAFEESFFAYAWAVQFAEQIGWTGDHVCLVGDSAGGNLCTAVAMRAANYGIRVPDGIVCIYTPFNVSFTPSPSRLMCLMDPLLPLGILCRCLAAYAGIKDDPLLAAATDILANNNATPGSPSSTDSYISGFSGVTSEGATPSREGAGSPAVAVLPIDQLLEPVARQLEQLEVLGGEDALEEEQTTIDLVGRLELIRDLSSSENLAQPAPASPSRQGLTLDLKSPLNRTTGGGQGVGGRSPGSPLNSPLLQFRNIPVVRNPYMSPMHATEDLLRGLPPVYIMACALDPILDDSIVFARRLEQLGKKVRLDIVEELPHGFLNFSLVSREARAASELVVRRVVEILHGQRESDDDDWEHLETPPPH